jgi:capsule polysaccharide export protein KpsE/RkpR
MHNERENAMNITEVEQIQEVLKNRRYYAQKQYEAEMKSIDDATADADRAWIAALLEREATA